MLRCGFEADSLDECVKVIDDAVVEAVKLRPLLIRDFGIGVDGAEETRRERGVRALRPRGRRDIKGGALG